MKRRQGFLSLLNLIILTVMPLSPEAEMAPPEADHITCVAIVEHVMRDRHMDEWVDRYMDGLRCWCEAPPRKTAPNAVRRWRGALSVDPSACSAGGSSRKLKNARLRIFAGT